MATTVTQGNGDAKVAVFFPFELSVPRLLDEGLRRKRHGAWGATCLSWRSQRYKVNMESRRPVAEWEWNPEELHGNAMLLIHQLDGCTLLVRGKEELPDDAKVVARYVLGSTGARLRRVPEFEHFDISDWVPNPTTISTDQELFADGRISVDETPPPMYSLEVADPFPDIPWPKPSAKATAALQKFSLSNKPQVLRITLSDDGNLFDVDRLGWLTLEKLTEYMEACVRPRWFLVRGTETAAIFGMVTRDSRDKRPKEVMETRLRYAGLIRALRIAAPGGLRIAIFRDYRYSVDVDEVGDILLTMSAPVDRRDRNPDALKLYPGTAIEIAEAVIEERDLQIADWALQDFQPVARPVVSQLVVEP